MRVALGDAAPLYRDESEAQEAKASASRIIETFMREALPESSEATRVLAGNLIKTARSEVGKQFSEPRERWRRSRSMPTRWRICSVRI